MSQPGEYQIHLAVDTADLDSLQVCRANHLDKFWINKEFKFVFVPTSTELEALA